MDVCYARCLRILMEGQGYPMLATHDPRLIQLTGIKADMVERDKSAFEYQMLYGIRPAEQLRLAASGAQVRVYVPYGRTGTATWSGGWPSGRRTWRSSSAD